MSKISPEIREYFMEQYAKAEFKVVPGHWPEMKSKADVDRWVDDMKAMFKALAALFEGD